eukprot:Partr_v1_DN24592_c1_g1_i2_m19930 putative cystinosin
MENKTWLILSRTFGWLYFVLWSLSLYPQIILNHRRRTTIGLSPDFVLFNLWGFSCYFIYTILLYFNDPLREEYRRRNGGADPLVRVNDVFFVSHVLVVSAVLTVQAVIGWRRARLQLNGDDDEDVFIHRSNDDSAMMRSESEIILPASSGDSPTTSGETAGLTRLSRPSVAFMALSGSGTVLVAILCLFRVFHWLDWVYYLSFVKLAATLFKCCPQLYINYRYKTTAGWSIENVLLDFVGGFFSLFQLFIDAYIADSWSGILGNPIKLFMGVISILLDSTFMLQHFVLYKRGDPWASAAVRNSGIVGDGYTEILS